MTIKQLHELPDDAFAVPELRKLRIDDRTHVSMAWRVIDNVKGISDEQRGSARRCILRRAHELGVSTSKWHLQPVAFSAMALEFPTGSEQHPNKLPFTGILTRLDRPSDKPLSNTGGKRVIISTAVAEAAIPSLLGMGVDFKPKFDGHRPRVKLGLITGAEVVGDAIEIQGFLYAADFPEEVQTIQSEREKMGFSFEAQSLMQDLKADPLVVEACEFTGAAVLYKDKAAYYDTSIAANADQEHDMTPEQIAQLNTLTESMSTVSAALKDLPAQITAAADAAAKKIMPAHAASLIPKVAPHAAALRNCAAAMMADGIGCHASSGHSVVLNRMADRLEAEAALGALPHVYRDHDYISAGAGAQPTADEIAKRAAEAATTAMSTTIKTLTDAVAAMGTKITDMQAAATAAVSASANANNLRKTLPAQVLDTIKRIGLPVSASGDVDGVLTVAQVNDAVKKAGLDSQSSIALKLVLRDAGRMA